MVTAMLFNAVAKAFISTVPLCRSPRFMVLVLVLAGLGGGCTNLGIVLGCQAPGCQVAVIGGFQVALCAVCGGLGGGGVTFGFLESGSWPARLPAPCGVHLEANHLLFFYSLFCFMLVMVLASFARGLCVLCSFIIMPSQEELLCSIYQKIIR